MIEDKAVREQHLQVFSASPLIYGNVWCRWSIIIRWTLTIKISQVLVAGGATGRPGSNHYGFTPLMMGRELIYPGEKQIKALLSPALRHTIAYINILSWVIQVSKGLVHLHFHKSPLSAPWPPRPSRLSFWWVPAVLSFTSLSSSFHFPRHLSILQQCLSHSRVLFLLSRTPPLELPLSPVCTFPPPPPVVKDRNPNIHSCDQLAWLRCLNPLWRRRITCWQTVQSTPWKTGFGWHGWKCHSDLWTRV